MITQGNISRINIGNVRYCILVIIAPIDTYDKSYMFFQGSEMMCYFEPDIPHSNGGKL
jgi:hypothetical protein